MSGATPSAPLARTALHAFHVRHGAHLVPFAGWEMPLYYSSILAEHRAVRSSVGLFDVSHMGLLTIDGAQAADLLARRTTANAGHLPPGQVRYAFFLEASGHIVDDLLVSRLDDGTELLRRFLVVPNAARAAEIEELLRQHRGRQVEIRRWNPDFALLAVQGPGSRRLLEQSFSWDLSALGFYRTAFFPKEASEPPARGALGPQLPSGLESHRLLSRTGYTGELGYELLVRAEEAESVADRLVAGGAVPAGLGARDTLRLEKGYLLSGQEFHRDHSPLEAGQERFVELDHPFVGRASLEKERADGVAHRLVGLVVDEPGAIPRHGSAIYVGAERVTEATSGGVSPELGKGIALAYLPAALLDTDAGISVEVRGRRVPAHRVELPFVRAPPTRG